MKFCFFLIAFLVQLAGFSQTKITGTLIVTPRASYFAPNRIFNKHDSVLLLDAIANDTLIQTSIGGHLVHEKLMDSISIRYNWAKGNEENYFKEEKLYFKCIYLIFDADTSANRIDITVNTHLIYLNRKPIAIKCRFKWVSTWDYCE